ncbi:MAG: triose-phosphate isomerase [bacterium]
MRRILVAGNWKLFGTIAQTEALLADLLSGESKNPAVDVLVCPPYTSLSFAARMLQGSHIQLGAQDMSEHESGAYTGEVSAEMLLTVGAGFVILGHSERRQYHAETDQLVNNKAKLALAAGLTPIICVGETLDQRQAGQTDEVVCRQIEGGLAGYSAEMLAKSVIAYEPVWAIGTGLTATPEQAQAVHALIRGRLAKIDQEAAARTQILYGGSVKPSNAKDLLGQPDIDGALVGGASLKADEFCKIIGSV